MRMTHAYNFAVSPVHGLMTQCLSFRQNNRQLFPEKEPRAVQAAFHGADRHIEDRCDLLVRQPLDLRQDVDGAIYFRQMLDPSLQDVQRLLTQQFFLRR
jgi:hypothetical protein